jgi:hypothetical protein
MRDGGLSRQRDHPLAIGDLGVQQGCLAVTPGLGGVELTLRVGQEIVRRPILRVRAPGDMGLRAGRRGLNSQRATTSASSRRPSACRTAWSSAMRAARVRSSSAMACDTAGEEWAVRAT